MCHVMTRSHTWVYRPISAVGPASPDICLEPSKSHHFTTVHQTQHSLSLLWRSHSFELKEYSTATLSNILSYYQVIWTQKGNRLLNSWMCIHPAAIMYICTIKYTCCRLQLGSQGRAEEGRVVQPLPNGKQRFEVKVYTQAHGQHPKKLHYDSKIWDFSDRKYLAEES